MQCLVTDLFHRPTQHIVPDYCFLACQDLLPSLLVIEACQCMKNCTNWSLEDESVKAVKKDIECVGKPACGESRAHLNILKCYSCTFSDSIPVQLSDGAVDLFID